ncbi:uncharacterized protein A4U43_C10F6760 [Asparagus officinalis]|uniref:Ternary complex factor MIP1 leucine-zipper domain-containing protein n=1 Tax=Asparagus officinalis TaxID=4686 RepID=A0A5P1E1G2_ASPOF|nr:uncharacterized protein A4U43_C10F6760 [Asparagus officinalis]
MGGESCSLHHKRSRSASDGNTDIARNGTSYSKEPRCVELKEDLQRSHRGQDSINHVSADTSIASLDHRASLENDIKKLQRHLHQEKTMRMMLERAIGRASSTLSPGHKHFTSQVSSNFSNFTWN